MPRNRAMIRAKLISPVNLQLERPIFNPVDSPEWIVMPLREYQGQRQNCWIIGAIFGAFVMALIAMSIFTWFQSVVK